MTQAKSTDILVYGMKEYGEGSESRLPLMQTLKTQLRENDDPSWHITFFFFANWERAVEHIEKCGSLDLVYIVNEQGRSLDDLVCDMGDIAPAVVRRGEENPDKEPWVILSPELRFLKDGALSGWGVRVEVVPLWDAVVRRWRAQQKHSAAA